MARYRVEFQSENRRITDNVYRIYSIKLCEDWDSVLNAIKDNVTYRYGSDVAAWDSPRCNWEIKADNTIRVKNGRYIIGHIVETSRD